MVHWKESSMSDTMHVTVTGSDTRIELHSFQSGEHYLLALTHEQAAKVAADILELIQPHYREKDACEDAVDMSRISPQEIRAHWQQQTQQGVEIIRALNHIEKGYKHGA
jgi:hypothetical protein